MKNNFSQILYNFSTKSSSIQTILPVIHSSRRSSVFGCLGMQDFDFAQI